MRRAGINLGAALCCVVIGLLGLAAGPARAATVYPAGGGTFTGDAQGWVSTEANCKLIGPIEVGLLCEAKGEYDSEHGNPAGSLTAETNAVVGALTVFESDVTFESPQFTVVDSGAMVLHLDSQFEPAGLLALGPNASYEVTLVDEAAVRNRWRRTRRSARPPPRSRAGTPWSRSLAGAPMPFASWPR